MSTLIPNVTISEFRKLKASQLKELKSCEVSSDGEHLFTFINSSFEPTGHIRTRAEYLGLKSNTVGGKPIDEILGADLAIV